MAGKYRWLRQSQVLLPLLGQIPCIEILFDVAPKAYTNMACGMLGLNVLDLLVHATLPALTTFLLIGTEALTFLLSSILVGLSFAVC